VGSPTTGGGIVHPNGLAVDGAGNVWVANYRGASISELAGANAISPGTPISPSTGFGSDASLSAPFSIAVDASGNVWVSNQGSNAVTEFLGAATPVKTPVIGPPQLP
jgi:streptogramin lyase